MKGSLGDLKAFKTHVIGLSQQAREYDRLSKKSIEIINANVTALQHSKTKSETLRSTLEEIYRSVPQYGEQKAELKQLKSDLSDHLNRLVAQAKNKVPTETINRWKESQVELDKRLSQLEVLLSKADMVLSSGRTRIDDLTSNYESEQISFAQNEIKLMSKSIASGQAKVEDDEAQIIASLRNIFEGTKSQMHQSGDAHGRLTN